MTRVYEYTVRGLDANGTLWKTTGIVKASNFPDALEEAQRESFEKLTNGEALFGHPGEGGCHGPYTIQQFTIKFVGGPNRDVQ